MCIYLYNVQGRNIHTHTHTHTHIYICGRVLGVAVRAARGASLDLSRAEADGEVGDSGILRLARPVRRHDAPARLLAHAHRGDRLGDGADLVHLEENRYMLYIYIYPHLYIHIILYTYNSIDIHIPRRSTR